MIPPTRTESDTMGPMPVPALWGAQSARAIINFQISASAGSPGPVRRLQSVLDPVRLRGDWGRTR